MNKKIWEKNWKNFCLTLKVFICELPVGFQPISLYNLAVQHVENQKGFSQVSNRHYVIEFYESYLLRYYVSKMASQWYLNAKMTNYRRIKIRYDHYVMIQIAYSLRNSPDDS